MTDKVYFVELRSCLPTYYNEDGEQKKDFFTTAYTSKESAMEFAKKQLGYNLSNDVFDGCTPYYGVDTCSVYKDNYYVVFEVHELRVKD